MPTSHSSPQLIPTATPRVPFYYQRVPKTIFLIVLSLLALPISSTVVLLSLVWLTIRPRPKLIQLRNDAPQKKTILVTGISMTKGLTIARILAQHTPHRIIGADTSAVSPGRVSCALSAFYKLAPPDGHDAEPYIDSLLYVLRAEGVDLWISCSSVLAAVEDGQVVKRAEALLGPPFTAIQFREDVVERLHSKDKFIDYIRGLNLPVPESHTCTSAAAVLRILLPPSSANTREKRDARHWILKPIGVDDKARNNMMTLLPFSSPDKTRTYVNSLSISAANPFQLQQYVAGAEYCTHALVVRGHVMAFVACPSSELLMHYEALPAKSTLASEMLAFTRRVAKDGGERFTGHLSFDFLVEGEGENVKLFPIECNPRAHTAVVLFANTPQMAGAYEAAFLPESALEERELVVPRMPAHRYYWIGHDLVTLLMLPVLDAVGGKASWENLRVAVKEFTKHLASWRDGTFNVYDPLPFWALYHVYWPLTFVYCLLTGRTWSRINVSTTKVFDS